MLLTYALLSAYCLAACLMEHFAVFAGWPAVGAAEFGAVQRAQGRGSGVIYVIPKTILTVVLVMVLVAQPAGVTPLLLWAALAALAASWISSLTIQIPMHAYVRRTADAQAIRRLLRIDWIRLVAMLAHGAFALAAVTPVLS
ncbi:hypothetical protein [Actinoplanes sp. NPDC049265]|uniref:hypothetical protein n=1 Tax=Actinoplanes sp. NPDC049265 TaxID=3363902 RepID=UPI0037147DD0